MEFENKLIEFIKKYEGLSKTESKLFGKEFSFINLIHRYDPIIYHKMLNIFGKNKN